MEFFFSFFAGTESDVSCHAHKFTMTAETGGASFQNEARVVKSKTLSQPLNICELIFKASSKLFIFFILFLGRITCKKKNNKKKTNPSLNKCCLGGDTAARLTLNTT